MIISTGYGRFGADNNRISPTTTATSSSQPATQAGTGTDWSSLFDSLTKGFLSVVSGNNAAAQAQAQAAAAAQAAANQKKVPDWVWVAIPLGVGALVLGAVAFSGGRR